MGQRDFCSKEGAFFLASQLRSYWALRGATIFFKPEAKENPATDVDRHTRYDIRSALVNGTPPGFVWRYRGGAWKLVAVAPAVDTQPVRRVALRA